MYDFVSVDFETCNRHNDPCQVALAFVRGGEIAETFSTLINPRKKFDSRISLIHGITEQDVVDAPEFPEVYQTLFRAFRHYPVVAHGAGFDRSVFIHACERYRLPVPKMTFYCTSTLYQDNAPELECYKLDALAERFLIPLDKHHDALCDAVACAKLFIRLLDDENAAIYPIAPPHPTASWYLSVSVEAPAPGCDRDEDSPSRVEPNVVYDSFDGIVCGKRVVITGDIEQATRAEISRMVSDAGGRTVTAVSSKTNYLAVGKMDASQVSDKVNFKSGKIISAETLRTNGAPIKIIRLDELYQSLMRSIK